MEKNITVATPHPQYAKLQSLRNIIADLRAGTTALRAKGKIYLPKYPAELEATYQARLQTATLLNLYKKTEAVMCGLVFQNEIDVSKVRVPVDILEDIDNRGNHFNIFARQVFEKSFDGASVILVDAPKAVKLESLETQKKLNIRPYWVCYPQSAVINWRFGIDPISQARRLSLIVFREETFESVNRFGHQSVIYYRVWFLTNENVVAWELYREFFNPNTKKIEYILDDAGELPHLSAIPVAIVGNLQNPPPLLDLAYLNLKLYQKESNFDMHEWQAAVNLFYTKGYEGEEALPIASDFHYKLPETGEIGWAQIDASGNDTMRESLKFLIEQISLLGLSQLADKTARVDLTATEALLANIGETAEIRVMAEQLKDALELALGFTAEYLNKGKDAGGEIQLNAAWNAKPDVQSVNINNSIKPQLNQQNEQTKT